MPYDFNPEDHQLYSPEKVDKFDFEGNKLVRLSEYEKVWEFVIRLMNQRSAS
jgi:hypothetical protein